MKLYLSFIKKNLILGILIIVLFSGCTASQSGTKSSSPPSPTAVSSPVISSLPPDTPKWISVMITDVLSQPVGNPPTSITQYDYAGKKVYYIPPQCCDVPSKVYDSDQNLICYADGGLTGKGDGKCPDFFSIRKNEKLIWKDVRM